ncbi:MAG: hypothetical protein J4G04_08370 [Nitrosopumilaceae archaeon]|nr:hypothetical protein [Nitrosopumilaceae archaeon]
MDPDELHLRWVGRIWFLAYEDENFLRLAKPEGCDFDYDEDGTPGVVAILWPANELRRDD